MASKIFLRSIRSVNFARSQSLLPSLTKKVQLNKIGNMNLGISNRAFSTSLLRTSVLKDLSNFLNEEIKLEQEARKNRNDLPKVTGFNVKTDGPNVTLTKKFNDEEVTVKFNVNGSLDNEGNVDQAVDSAKNPEAQTPDLKSRPVFSVEVKRGDQVLGFGCSYLPAEEGSTESVEDFQIDELTVHTGDWNENVYTADCSVLDDNLYDLLLNLLDERGIGEQFANELAEFSTSFEHQQYIGLLEKLQKFTK